MENKALQHNRLRRKLSVPLWGKKILAIFSESLFLTLFCFIPAIDFQGKYAVIQ